MSYTPNKNILLLSWSDELSPGDLGLLDSGICIVLQLWDAER